MRWEKMWNYDYASIREAVCGCNFIIPTPFFPVIISRCFSSGKIWNTEAHCFSAVRHSQSPILQISIFLSTCCHYSVTELRDDEAVGSLSGALHHGFVHSDCTCSHIEVFALFPGIRPGYLCCHCYKRSRLNGLQRVSKCQAQSTRLQPGRIDNCSSFSDLGLNMTIK